MKIFIFNILFFIVISTQAQFIPPFTGSNITREDAQDALQFHNKIRKDVGVKPLCWSIELATYAQEWANYLANDNCTLWHRPNNEYGENIFGGIGGEFTCLYASECWYSEIEEYEYGPLTYEDCHKVGHYTQMIWETTEKIGIGIVKCGNGGTIIVANYEPSGNIITFIPY